MSRKFSSWLFLLLICMVCTTDVAGQRKKVALVLGGGGAKGAAEVGVLKVLEEAHIPIDYIVGTSIGSIVGGLYAIGYSAETMDSLFRKQNWMFLLSDQIQRKDISPFSKSERERYLLRIPLSTTRKPSLAAGLVSGQNIYNMLTSLTIGYHDSKSFSNFPIPFACMAVDMVSGQEVVLHSGSLPLAMRASMSIPGVFSPVDINGMLLIDGGALNNFPVDVAKQMGADIVIGVDLSTGFLKKEELSSLPNVLKQLILVMGKNKYQQNIKLPDLYINPHLVGYGPASFQRHEIDSMISMGERAARSHWNELMTLRKKIYNGTPDTISVRHRNISIAKTDYIAIDTIVMTGVADEVQEWIRKRIKLSDHSLARLSDIERAVARLQGTDIFANVEYKLSQDSPYTLTFELKEKDYKSINLGIRFDNEELASILVNTSNEKKLGSNHHYSVTGRLSKNPYISVGYNYGNFFNPKFGLSYQLGYSDYRLFSRDKKVDVLNYLSQSLNIFIGKSIGLMHFQTGVRYDYFHYYSPSYDERYEARNENDNHFIDYYTTLGFDTYNNKYYPTRGGIFELKGSLYTDNGATYRKQSPVAAFSLNAQTVVKLSNRFCLLPELKGRFIFANRVPNIFQNFIGGIYDNKYLSQQISWESATSTYIVDRNFLSSRLKLRYAITSKLYLSAIGEYAKESAHFDNILRGKDKWGCILRTSYDSMVGPLSVQIHYSNMYKNLGYFISAGFYF